MRSLRTTTVPARLATTLALSLLLVGGSGLYAGPEEDALVESILVGAAGEGALELLPRDPETGRPLPIEKAREAQRLREERIERAVMQRHFAEGPDVKPEKWRKVVREGKTFHVPNELHPSYRAMVDDYDRVMAKSDERHQAKYGDRYHAFQQRVVDGLRSARQRQDGEAVELMGRAQETHLSDLDATMRDPELRKALVDGLERHGIAVTRDPQGHALYDKADGLDWVIWNEKQAADLRNDPERHGKALADPEVALVTEGAKERSGRGGSAKDRKGAQLDLIKKFAQSEPGYTQAKALRKVREVEGRTAPSGREAERAYADHHSDTRALRMVGWDPELKNLELGAYSKQATRDVVASYRRVAVEHHTEMRKREKALEALRKTRDDARESNPRLAATLDGAARRLERDLASIRETNGEALKSIALTRPDLATKLVVADRDAHREAMVAADRAAGTREGSSQATREARAVGTERERVRARVEARSAPTSTWSVTKASASKVLKGTQAAFGHVETVSGAVDVLDEVLTAAESGKPRAVAELAGRYAVDMAKQKALDKLGEKVPVVGKAMEILDIPGAVLEEFDRELEVAEREGTSPWLAKGRGIWNVFKKKTFAGTLEEQLNQVGMEEVDREMAGEGYNWGRVVLQTAVRTTGELTTINACSRKIADRLYGAKRNEREAAAEDRDLRDAVRRRMIGAERDLDEERLQLLEWKLSRDADTPAMRKRIARREKAFEERLDDLHGLAKRMRRVRGGQDSQTSELYERLRYQKSSLPVEENQIRMIRLATHRDATNPWVLGELIERREVHRKHLEDFQKRTQGMHASRGADDPLVKEYQARLRAMKAEQRRIDAIDISKQLARGVALDRKRRQESEDARWKEIYAERARRKALEDAQVEAFRQRSKAGALPSNVDPNDYYLLKELEDLQMQEEKGELEPGQDLLALAARRHSEETNRSDLQRRMDSGELDQELDRDALAAAMTELQILQQAGKLEEDVDLLELAQQRLEESLDVAGAGDRGEQGGADERDELPEDLTFQEEGAVDDLAEEVAEVGGGEVEIHRNPDGTPRYQESHARGQKHGVFKQWQQGGELSSSKSYARGKLHGPSRRWSKGVLVEEGFYSLGLKHGRFRRWDPQGQLRSEIWWKQDQQHGPERRWQSGSDRLEVEKHFRRGTLQGWEKIFRRDGSPEKERYWRDGDLEIERIFDRSGGLIRKQLYDLSGGPGISTSRRPWVREAFEPVSGERISREQRAADGTLIGLRETFDPASGRRTQIQYDASGHKLWEKRWVRSSQIAEFEFMVKDGRSIPHGPHKRWSPPGHPRAGKLWREHHYKQGVRVGRFMERDETTGVLLVQGQWADGLRDGTWESFDRKGVPESVRNYQLGLLQGLQKDFEKGELIRERFLDASGRTTWLKGYAAGGALVEHLEGRFAETAIAGAEAARDWPGGPEGKRFSGGNRLQDGRVRRWVVDPRGVVQPSFDHGLLDFQLHGKYREFYPSGKRKFELHYDRGQFQGKQEFYQDDGTLILSGSFEKGVATGTHRRWHWGGAKQFETHYEAGKLAGWCRSFDKQGKLETLAHFDPRGQDHPRRFDPRSASHKADWSWSFGSGGGLHGPFVTFQPDGKVKKMTFGCLGKGTTADVETYLKWYEEAEGLPQVVPGVGNILAPVRRKRRLAKQAAAERRAADKPLDLGSLTPVPEGMGQDEAHMYLMQIWMKAAKLPPAECEQESLRGVRLTELYPREGPRMALFSIIKAARCAAEQGAASRVEKYRDAAVRLAEEAGIPDEAKVMDSILEAAREKQGR